MKKYIKYLIGLFVIVIIFIGIVIYSDRMKLYSKNFFYMDTYINIKFYAKDSNKANIIFNKANNIYNKYQLLTDSYNDDSNISYINNNTSNDEILKIDSDLYRILELGLSWYEKSNNKFNINLGKVIKVWKEYRDNGKELPNINELKSAKESINDIVLLGDNKIKNTHPSIDLGAIAKGYATKEIGEMIKDNGIDNFVINAGGNVLVGKAYNKDSYSVGIENPQEKNDIYQVIKANNMSIVTSGGYERFYEIDGVRYHHIIDPDTLYPANNCLSVTVITPDSAIADILSTTLFLMSPNEGIELVNNMDDVEAIYYVNKDTIIKSKGFNKYE